MTTRSMAQNAVVEAFLDTAERLLVTVGYGGISARRVAEEAGANHGLIHYYFGSMEQLLVQVLERFTSRLIARQRGRDRWRGASGRIPCRSPLGNDMQFTRRAGI